MKSYSLYLILLLCLAIFSVDVAAYYGLQEILNIIDSSIFNQIIDVLFWFFSAGLIIAIITLKLRMDIINPQQKHLLISSLYGLTISSFIPKTIFIIAVGILYIGNYTIVHNVSLITIPLLGLFSGLLPFFIILYAIFKARYNFKVHHIKVNHKQLPEAFNGLKIIQISDLHLGGFNYQFHILDRAFEKINSLNPDLIVFTGDLVNNYAWELQGWEESFKKLQAKLGLFAVLGNHDYGDYSAWESPLAKQQNFENICNFFSTVNFKLLNNDSETIKLNNQEINIVGVENWGKPPFKQYGNLDKALTDVENFSFKILLSHDPSHWSKEVLNNTNIALTLSGHTHGMQAGISFGKKEWSPIKYKYKHWAGLYEQEEQFLYVNRGLGWLGFPGRMGMRPEITSITLLKD
ncbi:metallophosphoesterase [Bizionia sp. KMM 8389]